MKKKGPYIYTELLAQNNIRLWTFLRMHWDSHFCIPMYCVYSLPHMNKMCRHHQRLLMPEGFVILCLM